MLLLSSYNNEGGELSTSSTAPTAEEARAAKQRKSGLGIPRFRFILRILFKKATSCLLHLHPSPGAVDVTFNHWTLFATNANKKQQRTPFSLSHLLLHHIHHAHHDQALLFHQGGRRRPSCGAKITHGKNLRLRLCQ